MKKYFLSSLWILLAVCSVHAAEFYVAPDGKPTNLGSISSPWDLQTALNHPAAVKPGDTIWLRNGIHRLSNRVTKFTSRLAGTSSAPITVRQYPGERATIDGNLTQSSGGWVNYWGFEIYNSNLNRYTSQTGPWPTSWYVNYDGATIDLCVPGVDMRAPNVKMINMVVHDSIGGGFSVWREAQNSEMYGCISYYNGWQASDRPHGHGLYAQNAQPYTKNLKDTVFYGNVALNVQIYGSGPDSIVDNWNVERNVMYKSSILANSHMENFVFGAYQGYGYNDRIIGNYVYDTTLNSADSYLGYTAGLSGAVIQNNYFASSAQFASSMPSMNLSGNVFAGGTVLLDRTQYPNNTYLSSKPTVNKIAVHPNQYESGRANIVIYNWQKLSSVTVDVSNIGLNVGDAYELHNVQNFYGDVLTGTYNGTPITIPVTGRTVAKPQGQNFTTPASTFPEFGTFVIMKKAGSTTTTTNSAPVVSTISNQTVNQNQSTTAIGFTVSDKETTAANLKLTGTSANTALVPNANIVFGGSGTNRTVTVTPASNQTGTSTITIQVSDGTNTTSRSFTLTVLATTTNTTPVISTVASQTIAEDSSTSALAFSVSDRETTATSLAVSASSSNPTLVPTANIVLGGSGTNRTVTVKPAANQSGTATITLKVSDGTLTGSSSFGVTVSAVNDAPTIASIANQTTTSGTPTMAIPFTVADIDTAATSLTLTGTSSNPTLVPTANIVFGGSGSNRTVAVSPVSGQTGSAAITVTVKDGSLAASTSFTLTVSTNSSSTNAPSTNTTASIYVGVEAEDGVLVAPMATVTDSKLATRQFIQTTTVNTGTATYSVDIPKTATYVIWAKVLATSYANDSFFVSVDGQEDIFDAAEGKSSTNWQWSAVNGRGTTGAAQTLNPRTFNLSQGKHTIVIRGREVQTGLDRFVITDDRNYTPKDLTAVDDTVPAYAGTSTQILPADLLRNDISLFGDTLTISAVGSATNGTVVLGTSAITYTPKVGFVGKDTFTYTVKDGSSATSTAKVTVDVQGATNSVNLGFEAEAGLLTSPMALVTDSTVPTRKFVWTTTANQGSASYTIDIPKADTYVMWAKVLATSYASDSVFVSVDGVEDVFDAAEGKSSTNWQWSVVNGRGNTGTPLVLNPRKFSLAQGKHTIVFRGRELQTGIDRVVLTTDLSYVPKDLVAVADTVTATPGMATSIAATTLLANDVSLFQDALTIKSVTSAANGTVTLSGTSISYTPNSGFVGQDTFTYTVSDGQGGTATATVTVKVQSSTTAG